MPLRTVLSSLLLAGLLTASFAHANGVKPQTSVVIINEADGEGTISVKNTDATPVLLYSKLQNVPEDNEPLLVITPPMARVEGGQDQLVRFVLKEQAPLKTERLKRVLFEGIPTVSKGSSAQPKVTVVIRQNEPVIIHPRGLPVNDAPWQLLKWSVEGDHLIVRNDSAYVVRLAQKVQLLPQQTLVNLPKTYVLPGETLTLDAPASMATSDKVRLFPASVYGYAVPNYEAPLAHTAKINVAQASNH